MRVIFKVYPVISLLAATIFSPLPQSVIALGLFILGLYFLLRTLPRWEIPVAMAYLFVIPLLFQPVLPVFSPLLALPILPLISCAFKENALNLSIVPPTRQRELTLTSKSVLSAAGATTVVSILLGNWTLAISGGMALLLVTGILLYVFKHSPLPPVEVEQREIRLLAGNTTRLEVTLIRKTSFTLHISLNSSYSWVRPARQELFSIPEKLEIHLTLAPSLSGPSQPQIDIFSTDPWGLFQMRQVIEPVKLYVIPRARYAEWLARKYLEETASQAGARSATFSPVISGMAPRGGVEYYDSRFCPPGDKLKDIDWKHTVKLGNIIVKEYREEARQMAIIAANLAVANIEEADKLVYNLIVSALTLAGAIIPAAIAAYDHKQVLAVTPPLDSRDLVKEALQLGQEVVFITPLNRYIQPPDIRQLNISLRQLQGTSLETARKLREILQIERKAIEEGVKEHPAKEALNRVTAHALPPATITVISSWNHDNEALSLTLEELKGRGYNTTVLEIRN